MASTVPTGVKRDFRGVVAACVACVMGAAVVLAVDGASPVPAAAEASAESTTAATVSEARKLAKSTGQPVTVGSMLRERQTTQVAPDGSFITTQHLRPIRARADGAWKPVDATLVASGGGYAPRASTVDLRISGGGDGPLVSMSRAGRTLRFSWPETLPVPSIDGDKAVFRSVIDGVDLIVKADVDGFSHVLRVTTPQAASDPRLERLTLGLDSGGLRVAEKASRVLEATDANSGGAVFEAPQPIMWDSAGAASASDAEAASEDPVDGPSEGARVADVGVEVGASDVTLIPDQGLLLGEETVFPVYVDPQWKTVSESAWTMVSSGFPDEPYWKFKGAPTEGVGFCDVSWDAYCVRDQKKRVMFRLPATAFAGKHIVSATFTAYNTHSYDCADNRRVDLWRVAKFYTSTTWSNDNWIRYVDNESVSFCSRAPVEFSGANLRDEVQSAANSENRTISFGLKANSETTMEAWKRFADDAYLRVYYNLRPSKPVQSKLRSEPGGDCLLDPAVVSRLPEMRAPLSDPDGDQLYAQFGVGWDDDGDGSVSEQWTSKDPAIYPDQAVGPLPSGSTFVLQIPADVPVPENEVAYWKVRSWDGYEYSPWSLAGSQTGCYFVLNTSTPVGAGIGSTDYPEANPSDPNDPSYDGVGRYGEFVIDSPSDDVERYWIGVNGNPTPAWEVTPAQLGGPVTVKVAPEFAGENWVSALAINNAGTKSETTTYNFNVNAGAPAKAHWKLDDPRGSSQVVDSAGTAHGSVNGEVSLEVDGVVGTAMNTNGTDAYAKTANQVVDTSTSFAVAAWARLTDPKQNHAGIIATQAGDYRSGFELYYSSHFDRWIFNRYDADASGSNIVRAQSDAPPVAGQWAHLVGVYDSVRAEIRLYVNGELAAATPYDQPWNATGPVHIGVGWYGSRSSYFGGDIDDVQVFDRILSGEEAQRLYRRNPVVAGRWRLDSSADQPPAATTRYLLNEPVGATRAEDAMGVHPAGVNGDVTFGVTGKYSTAANFNGSNSYLATTGKVMDTTQSFSVSAWAKLPAARPSQPGIIATQAGIDKSGFELYYSSRFDRWIFNRYDADVDTGSNIIRAQSTAPPNDQWTHLLGVYDAGAEELRLYVNGKWQESTPYNQPWSASGSLQIGVGWYGEFSSYFDGDIDDVQIFDRIVSGTEAAVLSDGMPRMLSDDESVNGHHLTLRGSATTDSWSMVGTGSLALGNDGGYADTDIDDPVVSTKESFTVAGWVTGSPTADAAVFSQAGVVNSGFTLRYSPSLFNGFGGYQVEMPDKDATGAVRQVANFGAWAPGSQWDHVAIVYDAFRAEMRLYVNGELQQTDEYESSRSNTVGFDATGPFQLGRTKVDGAWGEQWPGRVDDVWAFRGVLSKEQIQRLRNGTEYDTYPGP